MARAMRILMGTFLVGMSSIIGPVAYAADSCDTVVVDETNDRVLGEQTEILEQADRLADLGADVRVRAFEAAPGGNLDTYLQERIASCPSWSTITGDDVKTNMVVFLVSLDRQSLIFYGGNWEGALKGDVDRIRADHMNAQFRNGDYVAGIVDAQKEAHRVMDNWMHPTNNGALPSVSAPSEPVDYSGLVRVVVLTAIVLASGLMLFLLVRVLYLRYVDRQDRRRTHSEALARATTAKAEAARAIAPLVKIEDPQSELSVSWQILMGQLDEDDQQLLGATITHAKELSDRALIHNSQFTSDALNSDFDVKRTAEDLDAITAQYEQIAAEASAATTAYEAVEESYDELQAEVARAPQRLQKLQLKLGEVRQLHQERVRDGFNLPGVDKDIAAVASLLVAAQEDIQAEQPARALGEFRNFEQSCEKIVDSLSAIYRRQQELVARQSQLGNELSSVEMVAQSAQEQFTKLRSDYNQACSDDLVSGSASVGVELESARAAFASAGVFLSMQSQQWDKGEGALDKAEKHARNCKKTCETIMSRIDGLERFASSASSQIGQLLSSIGSAKTTVNGLRGGQQKYVTALGKLPQLVDAVQAKLEADKPDYLAIQTELESIVDQKNRIAKEAQGIEDAIVAEERRRREAQERERQRVLEEEKRERDRLAAAQRAREEREAEDRREEARERQRQADATSAAFNNGSSGGSSGSFGGGGKSGGSSGGW